MNHTTQRLRMTCKLKQLSISLVLLSCFAVTNRVGAMDFAKQRMAEFLLEKQQEATKDVDEFCKMGLNEKDMPYIRAYAK